MSQTLWRLFDCDITAAASIGEIGAGTSAKRTHDLLVDQVNGSAELNVIPIPLNSKGVSHLSVTAVSTFAAARGISLRNLVHAPHEAVDMDAPFRARCGIKVKKCYLRNANTVAMARAIVKRPPNRSPNRSVGSKSTADTTDYEISATGVQVKVGHLVNTSDRMRFEALGVSMTLAVEAAVHLRENKSTLGGSDIILMFSINPDPLRIPNLFNFGPKNLRFHLDGAVIAETVVEVIPGPEDLLAEAYEFMDALTGEPVTNVGVTVVCNDVEEVLNSGDDHGVELPLNLPEGEAKCSLACPLSRAM